MKRFGLWCAECLPAFAIGALVSTVVAPGTSQLRIIAICLAVGGCIAFVEQWSKRQGRLTAQAMGFGACDCDTVGPDALVVEFELSDDGEQWRADVEDQASDNGPAASGWGATREAAAFDAIERLKAQAEV